MVDEEEGCGKILKKMNINCYSFILIVLLCEPLPIERSATILFLKIKAMSMYAQNVNLLYKWEKTS
jgi:hypothetical protein